MSSHASLTSATQDRKARLAQLKSLKRKQPPTAETEHITNDEPVNAIPNPIEDECEPADITKRYLSGRNYDPETRGPKLGFEANPAEGQETLEQKAARVEAELKQKAEEEAKADQQFDLFRLQPKKPNWDLKRDLEEKLRPYNVKTENAIAKLVRQRIDQQKKAAEERRKASGATGQSGEPDGAEEVGMEGAAIVEAMHVREREQKEEQERERREDEASL